MDRPSPPRALGTEQSSSDLNDRPVERNPPRTQGETHFAYSATVVQQFLDHLPGAAYVKNSELRVVMANRTFKSLLGFAPEDLIGKSNTEIFPGAFGEKLDADDRAILASGKSVTIEETYDGRAFESTKFVIDRENGKRMLAGITLEVTHKRKLFERQAVLLSLGGLAEQLSEKAFLQHGLEEVERLTGSQTGFLHFVNEDGKSIELVTWTHRALQACNASHDTHYPLDLAGIWADCARTGNTTLVNDYVNCISKKGLPEGHAHLVRFVSVPVVESGRVRMILGVGNKASDYDDYDCSTAQMIANDLWRIVRRMRLEASLKQKLDELTTLNARLEETNNRLVQSDKLASIGQLAAGVAHEINNPIGFVSSNLNALSAYVDSILNMHAAYRQAEQRIGTAHPEAFAEARKLQQQHDLDYVVEDIRSLLDESRDGLTRVRKIVQDLKDFSRAGQSEWQRANLHQGLDSTLNIVQNEIKYKARVEKCYGSLPEVYCIPSQLNQVFMNLLTNAAQAIPEHGKIVLRTECNQEMVWIEVEDDGIGIHEAHLERIFDPFFTTKPVGQGTGLGLSLSWSIIQRHRGKIEVRSTPGQGTVFRISLPIEPPQDAQPAGETPR